MIAGLTGKVVLIDELKKLHARRDKQSITMYYQVYHAIRNDCHKCTNG